MEKVRFDYFCDGCSFLDDHLSLGFDACRYCVYFDNFPDRVDYSPTLTELTLTEYNREISEQLVDIDDNLPF